MKAALLISGADRCKYGKLKDELANNYLLGMDQYLDAFEKHCALSGTIKTRQTAYHTDPIPTTQAWRSSNKEEEADVEQDE